MTEYSLKMVTTMNSANEFKACFERLEVLTGKPMSDSQIRSLMTEFRRIGPQKTENIISQMERVENLPKNIYGAVLNAIDRMREAEEVKLYSAKTWKAQELCTSPDDFELFFKIIALIMKLHADDVVKRNDDPDRSMGPDLETWHKMGCKKTWSPLVDNFLMGYITVYKNDKACTKFMRDFYTFLVQIKIRKEVPNVREEN